MTKYHLKIKLCFKKGVGSKIFPLWSFRFNFGLKFIHGLLYLDIEVHGSFHQYFNMEKILFHGWQIFWLSLVTFHFAHSSVSFSFHSFLLSVAIFAWVYNHPHRADDRSIVRMFSESNAFDFELQSSEFFPSLVIFNVAIVKLLARQNTARFSLY